jgi:organic hydroperoxide reductase OsmC/OhrA
MTGKLHTYSATVEWTGNAGTGTSDYRAYRRDHVIRIPGKPDLLGSSDPAFRGDVSRHNPEDLLVASLSACHMLWYLHQASVAGVVVSAYVDEPVGLMAEDRERGGWFTKVTLKPTVTISAGTADAARAAHDAAHKKCFIANSVNFPVEVEAKIIAAGAGQG